MRWQPWHWQTRRKLVIEAASQLGIITIGGIAVTRLQRAVTQLQRAVTQLQRAVTQLQRAVTQRQRAVTQLQFAEATVVIHATTTAVTHATVDVEPPAARPVAAVVPVAVVPVDVPSQLQLQPHLRLTWLLLQWKKHQFHQLKLRKFN